MTLYIYYTKEGKFENSDSLKIPWGETESPNEETPAMIYPNGFKIWKTNGKVHRLSGPAKIWKYGKYEFWVDGVYYTFIDWIHNHPNIDLYLEANGYKTEAQKAFWKLKNL